MKRLFYILYIILIVLPGMVLSQNARINLTSGYLIMGEPLAGTYSASNLTQTYIVIDNNQSTALTAAAGTGIVSSGEFNMVQWDIGTATGTYTLPFISDNLVSIPLVATISAAGTNGGSGNSGIEFSTWHTESDNWTGTISINGHPLDVLNMDAAFAGRGSPSDPDNSYNVVDRFWIIDTKSSLLPSGETAHNKYSTSPTISLTFNYLGAGNANSEVSLPNVQPMDGQLIPQRFNSGSNTWSDYFPGLVSNTAGGNTGQLVTSGVASANWFRSWTLSNSASPLPIKLLSFTAECQNSNAVLTWSTATEVNNDYFTVSRSSDGINFQTVAIVKGAGNSSSTLNYSTTDNSPLFGTSYYRLSQTDLDGNTTIAGSVSYTACSTGNNTIINAYSGSGFIDVQIYSADNATTDYNIALSNDLGQNIFTESKPVVSGPNEFRLYNEVANGVYFLTVSNNSTVYHKKILIKK